MINNKTVSNNNVYNTRLYFENLVKNKNINAKSLTYKHWISDKIKDLKLTKGLHFKVELLKNIETYILTKTGLEIFDNFIVRSQRDISTKEVNQILKYSYRDLKFDKKKHHYTCDGHRCVSTSKFIETFKKPFPKNIAAYRTAEKHNKENPDNQITAKEVIYQWDIKNANSVVRGNIIHKYAELFPNIPAPTNKEEQAVYSFFKSIESKYEVVTQEVKLFWKKYYRAGTFDLLLRDKVTGELVLCDWKTNKANLIAYRNYTKLLTPFNYLSDTKYNTYQLQLSDYKLLLEETTCLKISKMILIWITDDIYDLDGKEPEKYTFMKEISETKTQTKFHLSPLNENTYRMIKKYDHYALFELKDYGSILKEYLENNKLDYN